MSPFFAGSLVSRRRACFLGLDKPGSAFPLGLSKPPVLADETGITRPFPSRVVGKLN